MTSSTRINIRWTLFLVLVFLLVGRPGYALVSNLGLIDGVWFSESEYFVGDDIEIHTALFNHSHQSVVGTVEFFDNHESLGSRAFQVGDRSIAELVWTTVATEGRHTFSVEITESSTTTSGEIVELTPMVVESDAVLVIDLDTDNDNIADDEDTDDDNDGYTDKEELAWGSDPKDASDYPVEEDEDSTSDTSNQDIIDRLIELLGGNQETISTPDSLTSETSSEENQNLLVEEPVVVSNFVEDHPGVETVTTAINSVQNSIVGALENQRDSTKQKIAETQGISSTTENQETVSQSSRLITVLRLLWINILGFFSMIVGCLWCFVLVVMAVLYLITKFIFGRLRGR